MENHVVTFSSTFSLTYINAFLYSLHYVLGCLGVLIDVLTLISRSSS